MADTQTGTLSTDTEVDEKADEKLSPEEKHRLDMKEQIERLAVLGKNPKIEAARLINNLESQQPWAKQFEGMTALQTALISVLEKLKGQAVDIKTVTIQSLPTYISLHGPEMDLNIAERVAVERLGEFSKGNAPKSLAAKLKSSWKETVETADRNWVEKSIDGIKKNPGKAMKTMLFAAAGIWAVSSLFSMIRGSQGKAEGTRDSFKTALMIGSLVLAGKLIGDNWDKIFGAVLAGRVQREIETMGKVSEKTQEQVAEKGGKAAEELKRIQEGIGQEVDESSIETEKHKPTEIDLSPEKEDELKYNFATTSFLKLYFYQRKIGPDERRTFKQTLSSLHETPFSTIKSSYEAHKTQKSIPKTDFPSIESTISDEDLFLLFEGMVKISSLTEAKMNPEINVYQLFVSAGKNPFLEQIDGLQSGLAEAISKGDFTGVVDLIADQGQEYLNDIGQFGEKLEAQLGLEVDLNEEDEKAYRNIQLLLINNSQVSQDPQKAVENVIAPNRAMYEKHPKAIKMAVKMFTKVKERTPDLLNKVYANFSLGENDLLRKAVKMETLGFSSACELVALEVALEDTGDTLTSIALLNTILRAFDNPDDKEAYIAKLVIKLGYDAESIGIRGIKKVKENLNKITPIAGNMLWDSFKRYYNMADAAAEERPTNASGEEFAKRATGSTLISFGAETIGTTNEATKVIGASLDLPATALAGITLALGIEEWELVQCVTGEDFLKLVQEKGGGFALTERAGGDLMVIIQAGGDFFVARPGKTLGQALYHGVQGRFGDAMKIWTVSSAPFVVYGAFKGGFTSHKVPGGKALRVTTTTRLKNAVVHGSHGLFSPVTVPHWAYKRVMRTLRHVATGTEGVKTLGKDIANKPRALMRWMKDLRFLGMPVQNVENLAVEYQATKRFYERIKDRPIHSPDITRNQWEITRKAKRGAAEFRTAKSDLIELMTAGSEVREKLVDQAAVQEAIVRARRTGYFLNSYFQYGDEGFHMLNMGHRDIKAILDSAERLMKFGDYSKAHPELMKKVDDLARSPKAHNLAEDISDLLKSTGLDKSQRLALGQRIKDNPGSVKQIFKQAEAGAVMSNNLAAKRAASSAVKKTASAAAGPEVPKKTSGTPKKPTTERATTSTKKDSNTAKPTEASIKPALAAPAAALKAAQSNLAAVDRQIIAMQAEIMALHEASKKPGLNKEGMDELLEKALKANQRLTEAEKARATLRHSVGDLEKYASRVAEIEERLSNLNRNTTSGRRMAANLRSELESATLKANQALETATDAGKEFKPSRFKALNQALKNSKGLKYALKGLGLGFAGWSTYEAVNAGREAWGIHDNTERAAYKWTQAGLLGTNAVVDTTALAGGALASKYAIAKTASRVAGRAFVPLIPITIVGGTMLETAADDAKKDFEWAQTDPSVTLHNFATSTNSFSLGDAWMVSAAEVASWMTVNPTGHKMPRLSDVVLKKRLEAKKETAHQIFRSLVAIQKDPNILQLIYNHELPKEERSKKIKDKIKAAYSEYHEFYFPEDLSAFKTYDYAEARSEILDAQLFDTIMSERDKNKKAGQPFLINGVDLTASDYDIPNGKGWRFESKHKQVEGETVFEGVFSPNTVVDAYKKELEKVLEVDPQITKNVERMDTAYLLKLYVQMSQAIREPKNKEDLSTLQEGAIKLGDYLVFQMTYIQNHLTLKRGIDFETAVRQAENFKPEMSLEQITQHLAGFMSPDNKTYLDYEKSNYRQTPAVHALRRLAEYFGYAGEPNEAKLQTFFSPELASFRGVYWKEETVQYEGKEEVIKGWYLQEAGVEFDDYLGEKLDAITLNKMVTRMRHNKDDVLEHRLDQMGVSAYDQYDSQVENMAKMLEDGLDEGNERGYDTLSPFAINYEVKDENATEVLKQQFADTISAVKEKTGSALKQVNFEVKDENTIEISRTDTGNKVDLHRSGERWSVGDYYGDLTLLQAVALGNLKNFTEDWMKREGLTGDGKSPFEMNGNNIELNVNWNPLNRTVITQKGLGKFYNEIGVTTKDVHEMLNNWHQMENTVVGKAKKASKEAMRRRLV